ncbi:hypothetical protein [Nocardia sp. NPDC003345]
MNRSFVVPAIDLAAALVALALAVLCWQLGVRDTDFPATGDVPAYTATRYVGPWLFLATVLVAGAGVATIDAAARVLRPREGHA